MFTSTHYVCCLNFWWYSITMSHCSRHHLSSPISDSPLLLLTWWIILLCFFEVRCDCMTSFGKWSVDMWPKWWGSIHWWCSALHTAFPLPLCSWNHMLIQRWHKIQTAWNFEPKQGGELSWKVIRVVVDFARATNKVVFRQWDLRIICHWSII